MLITAMTPEYCELADRCRASFARFGLEVIQEEYFYGVGTWLDRVLSRPGVAMGVAVSRERLGVEPIWVLDADLQCLQDPPLLRRVDFDIAVSMKKADSFDMQVSAGLVGFGPTVKGAMLFACWVSLCVRCLARHDELERKLLLDQVALRDTLVFAQERGLDVLEIDSVYNARVPQDVANLKDVIILHEPASRTMRARIDGAAQ